ncbi:hypothetical protein [Actinospongicola halichondriae]|uniref:hypothetical protein n=1 Tax=Actinospongicola halichondriae TaxID=3236844 RepID=UPI003D55FEE5
MSESERTSDASLLRLVAIHAALVAAPVLAVALALRLWLLALPLAIVVGVVVTAVRVRGVDDRVARAVGATEIGPDDQPRLAGLAESVAMASGVASPRLFVITSSSVNALSWGAGNGPTCLAVTTGMLDAADPIILEAVVGHHLGPARTSSLAETTLAASLFGPFAKGPLTGPVVSLIQGDDERSVVHADLEGVRATQYPPGLVRALHTVRSYPTDLDVPPALAGLFFAAPVADDDPFAVHPPLDDRIDLLREV